MILLSHLEPITSDMVVPGQPSILLSKAQNQLYMLKDCDMRYIKIFGRPSNYGLYSCDVEEIPFDEYTGAPVPFYTCSIDGMYKFDPSRDGVFDLSIDWSR